MQKLDNSKERKRPSVGPIGGPSIATKDSVVGQLWIEIGPDQSSSSDFVNKSTEIDSSDRNKRLIASPDQEVLAAASEEDDQDNGNGPANAKDLRGKVSVVDDGEERSPLYKNRGIESRQEAEREEVTAGLKKTAWNSDVGDVGGVGNDRSMMRFGRKKIHSVKSHEHRVESQKQSGEHPKKMKFSLRGVHLQADANNHQKHLSTPEYHVVSIREFEIGKYPTELDVTISIPNNGESSLKFDCFSTSDAISISRIGFINSEISEDYWPLYDGDDVVEFE
ncbi:hypothetical protein QYF36_010142 [Acer negundo]|nr:hypothetical protein QYF36_010142 [Acer negundo]